MSKRQDTFEEAQTAPDKVLKSYSEEGGRTGAERHRWLVRNAKLSTRSKHNCGLLGNKCLAWNMLEGAVDGPVDKSCDTYMRIR